MPRPRRADVRPNPGRPVKIINWDLVDELLLAGCSGAEIAPHFDMHPETFYQRCQIEKGMGFTGYSQDKHSKGCGLLKHKQFKQAIQGNAQLLMFLGKVRLNQRETTENLIEPEKMTQYLTLLDQLNQLQQARNPEPKTPENDSTDPQV